MSRNGNVFALLGFGLLLILMGSFLLGCVSRDSTRMIRSAGQDAARSGLIAVPLEAAKPCSGAALPTQRTVGEAWAFGYAQTQRLEVCDERRALGVEAMELHNTRVNALVKELKPKPWWRFW